MVTSVAFSPDGKRVVSGSYDRAAVREPLEGHTDSVTFPSDYNNFTTTPLNAGGTAHSPPLHSCRSVSGERFFNSSSISLHWQIHNGWVSYLPSELLFWLPLPLRVGLWSPHTTLVIGQQQTLLSYKNFVYGPDWAKCAESPQ
ncbi:hypothetical protein B0H16DRAFT_907442 [Mycena metata]|uniref:Uncharacterized protein n=1 Tax=Mycena metata TaxID=1033252 RepID=A0AAD7N823_9AGAR|nr:hypothetical protein B0H16DRAFT_907442 [Mycena metata]